MTTAGSSSLSPPSGLCIRCKEHPATLDLRTEPVCSICFAAFIQSKAIKRLEVLQRETRGGPTTTTTTPTPNPKPSPSSPPQRYLVALSLGPSSTALLRVLCENARRQKGRRGRGGVRFDLAVVHVDTSCVDDAAAADGSSSSNSKRHRHHRRHSKQGGGEEEEEKDNKKTDPLTPYRALFPEVADFRVVPLSSVLRDPDVDWSALPLPPPPPPSPRRRSPEEEEHATDDDDDDDDQRLRVMFSRLPSPSARADVRRLLVRRALLTTAAAAAVEEMSQPPPPLLLGYSTTALAELTLSETAKGRGFAVPAAASDGVVPVRVVVVADPSPSRPPSPDSDSSLFREALKNSSPSPEEQKTAKAKTKTKTVHIHVYSPLRELFRKELVSYLRSSSTSEELAAALPDLGLSSSSSSSSAALSPSSSAAAAVVSHRDLSIDDVVARYFGEVEAAYPSVVANVVRTTGKLLLRRPAEGVEEGDEGRGGGGGEERCGLCGMGLDVEGSERWRGEIGEGEEERDGDGRRKKLCYGCERSVRG
ncbi:hypothetical protein F5X96DRAFT_438604 [Biscogniauxia mediterranea]|nr:hypothetical protein F5X96DRAFT_438604 [Biscogniauxia mediterranea]